MSQDERKAQLRQAAAKYFEGLAKKDFNLIPYDDDVSLRTPLAPGGIHKPLVGKENLRTVWWTPLPAILGEVRVFDFYYNDDLAAVVGEAEVEITNPKARLRVADRFTVNSAGKIVEQVNHFDPRDVTNPT
jgi:SnoaL-like domain